jgi:soluble lytic murein transglycosylase-like protein
MSRVSRVKKLVLNATSLLIHFAHGGLLVSGMLVAVLVAAYFGGALETYLPAKSANAAEESPQQMAADEEENAAAEPVVAVAMSDAKPLKPEMRAVVGYLARKYRVSGVAIEPVVTAAQAAGSKVGLDPLLIIAVAAVESRFNPFAESAMGAQGLMQVIPKFHQDKLAAGDAGKTALLDPHTNIQVGARVLKEAIARAGSVQAGLQQYAGAPGGGDSQYAVKVMAEKQRLEQAGRQQAQRRSRQVGA